MSQCGYLVSPRGTNHKDEKWVQLSVENKITDVNFETGELTCTFRTLTHNLTTEEQENFSENYPKLSEKDDHTIRYNYFDLPSELYYNLDH